MARHIRFTIAGDMTTGRQLGADPPQREALSVQLLGQGHSLEARFGQCLAAAALARELLLAIARDLELVNHASTFELRKRATICRIMMCDGSEVSVRSSPLAVSTRTPSLPSIRSPSSCAIRSRANRRALQ